MEGGVTVILTLLILFGVIAGGVALFGAGGFVQRRKEKEMADDEGSSRPRHTVVDNETADVQVPNSPSTSPTPPE
ncbi:MAG TPA: hypothetical protein VGV67_02510 [Solirubrobacteraceae bacterium]|nr:hypothetical protein [Solirubrobacteraceae bacterium]